MIAAGKRTEHAVSVPRARTAEHSQSETPAPLMSRRVSDALSRPRDCAGCHNARLAGSAEGKFNHMRLTHYSRQLPAQIADDRASISNFGGKRLGEPA